MVNVVHEERRQCDPLAATDPAQVVAVARRHVFDNVKQVGVVTVPEGNQRVPVGVLVRLEPYPRLMLIAGELAPIGQLPPYETLVVVRCRIDQVADDLVRRPPVGGWTLLTLLFRDGPQSAW